MVINVLFRRKIKNRRLGRDHVLDVKLRSTQVWAGRTRLAVRCVTVLAVTVFGIYLLWRSGDWLLTRLIYENKAFSIQNLDIESDGIIGASQVCLWAGLKPHQNLLALDLARVKRNLELVPLIQSASIERILPRTLRIRVLEREPVAQVHVLRLRPTGGVEVICFLLDPEGYVIVPVENRSRGTATANPETLPIISGVDGREFQPGRRIGSPQLQAALQLILAFQQSPMLGLVELKSIDISAREILVVKTGQACEVTFGLSDIEQQLRRWREIYDASQKVGKAIATVDLSVSSGIPLRLQEQTAVPPAVPTIPKPLRLKKKHV